MSCPRCAGGDPKAFVALKHTPESYVRTEQYCAKCVGLSYFGVITQVFDLRAIPTDALLMELYSRARG